MIFHVEKVCRAGHRFITDTKTILFPFTTFSLFLQSPLFHFTIEDKVVKCKLFFPTHKHLYKDLTIQNSKKILIEIWNHLSINLSTASHGLYQQMEEAQVSILAFRHLMLWCYGQMYQKMLRFNTQRNPTPVKSFQTSIS